MAYDDDGPFGPSPDEDGHYWLEGLRPGRAAIDEDFGDALLATLADHPDIGTIAIVTDGGDDMAAQVDAVARANRRGAAIYVFGYDLDREDREAAQQVARDSGGALVDL